MALVFIGVCADAYAAPKDKSMCNGLSGVAKGLCTAAAALDCTDPTAHPAQCDVLAAHFAVATGETAPWVAPPPPPPPPAGNTATMLYDVDAFDLDHDAPCADALGAPCNLGDPIDFRQPNDLSLTFDDAFPDEAILVPTFPCDDSVFIVGVAFLAGRAFDTVDASVIGTLTFDETGAEAPFAAGDTIVMRTCDLGYFKIGNVQVGADRATFSYERLAF